MFTDQKLVKERTGIVLRYEKYAYEIEEVKSGSLRSPRLA
jgi:hypothetical protein